MASAERENTQTYIEKAIGRGFKMRSRGYSSNGIIKRTIISGKGNAYSCGERVNNLGRNGNFITDVGILAAWEVASETGQFDAITMQFEELLSKNKYGFSVYTNMQGGTVALPLKYNTTEKAASTKYEAKESYRYYWDHTIYTSPTTADAKTITATEYTNWKLQGWNTDRYDALTDQLNIADVEDEKIVALQNGQRPQKGWIPALFNGTNEDQGIYDGAANAPRLPETRTYYAPDVTITQTIYCEDDKIVRNILEANGRLFAPRKTDRSRYDTYAISGDDTTIDDDNEHWLCVVNSVDTQSAISKVKVSYKYREFGWDTEVYQAYKRGWDAFTNTAISAAQPSLYG